MTSWPFEIADSGLRFREADPLSPQLDEFDCGSEPWCGELNAYIRQTKWVYSRNAETALEFGFDEEVVGYAVSHVSPTAHPTPRSRSEADYVILQVVALSTNYQGRSGPRADDGPFIDAVLRAMETVARDHGAAGLRLYVHENNRRAIGAYERNGFVVESDRPDSFGLLVMRKVLA